MSCPYYYTHIIHIRQASRSWFTKMFCHDFLLSADVWLCSGVKRATQRYGGILIAEAWERGAGEDVIEDDIRCL